MTKAKAKTPAEEDLIGDGPVPAADRKVNKNDNGGPNTAASKELRGFIERVERLMEDRSAVQDDIREVFGEAKGRGYDAKIMRRVIKVRAQDKAKRQEEDALFHVYCHALGMADEE